MCLSAFAWGVFLSFSLLQVCVGGVCFVSGFCFCCMNVKRVSVDDPTMHNRLLPHLQIWGWAGQVYAFNLWYFHLCLF